jgi:restriction endonuclease S subunit
VFLVRKGEIEGVWNSEFYKTFFIENRKKLRNCKFGLIKLSQITSKITKGETPLWRGDSYLEQGILFIKSENVLENKLTINDTKYIANEVHARMKRSQLKKMDVLFNIVGASIGRSCVFDIDEEANINQAVCLIRLKDSSFNPKWLAIILNSRPYQTWINQLKSGGARDNIDLNQVNNFEIPQHPPELQTTIIKKFATANTAKIQKEAEAAALLASIDGYLLEALGIKLPPPSTKKAFFYTRSSNVSSGRFDPEYFDIKFSALRQSIQAGSYNLVPVGKVCCFLSTGKTPARNDYSDSPTAYPLIKVASYSGDTIDLNKTDYANTPQPYTVQKGDIFVLSAAHQASYVGRFVKQLDENPSISTSFVGELICLRANASLIEPNYLFALFSSETFQTLLNCEKRGQTSHIYPNDIRHIKIPVPPLEIQTEIANHINQIRAAAKRLQQQAQAELEQAKQQVEKMILGEQ